MISQRFEGYEWESGISLYKLNVTWNYGITVLLNKIILFKFYLIILNSGSTISVTILQVSNPVWYVGNPDKATVDLTIQVTPPTFLKMGDFFHIGYPWIDIWVFYLTINILNCGKIYFNSKNQYLTHCYSDIDLKGTSEKENERGYRMKPESIWCSCLEKTVSKLYQNVYM